MSDTLRPLLTQIHDTLRWLNGEVHDDRGLSFGDRIPGRGAFWWRDKLRPLLQATSPLALEAISASPTSPQVAVGPPSDLRSQIIAALRSVPVEPKEGVSERTADAILALIPDQAALVKERDEAVASRAFTENWYAVRLRAIEDVAKRTGTWREIAAIIANGTPDARTPPTYAQQLNVAQSKRDSAVAALREAEKAFEPVVSTLGFAEWASPEGAEAILHKLCANHWSSAKEALTTIRKITSGEAPVQDGWRDIESAPKGVPSENAGCRHESKWFQGRVAGKYLDGHQPATMIIRRRAWPHHDGWADGEDTHYVSDFFDAWRPAPPQTEGSAR